MKVDTQVRVGGRYRFHIKNMETGEERITPWTDNLITDLGLEAMLGSVTYYGYWARYCFVGTGVTPPTNGDTSLAAQFGVGAITNTVDSQNATGSPDYIVSQNLSYTFAQGNFPDGTILNEVGVGVDSTGTLLVSRSLIQPAITVNAIEQLTVQYRLDFHVDQTIQTGTISVTNGPQNIGYTLRAARAASTNHIYSSIG